MNVIAIMDEINLAANSMVGESSLPNFLIATDDRSEFMRVSAFDQLDCAFNRHVGSGSQEQMNMLRHDDESVQVVAAFAAMPVKCLQEKAYVSFDDKQFPAMVGREGHEISSRRGEEPSRLQKRTSAAESRTSLQTVNWHEWNSCPSRLFSCEEFRFGTNEHRNVRLCDV